MEITYWIIPSAAARLQDVFPSSSAYAASFSGWKSRRIVASVKRNCISGDFLLNLPRSRRCFFFVHFARCWNWTLIYMLRDDFIAPRRRKKSEAKQKRKKSANSDRSDETNYQSRSAVFRIKDFIMQPTWSHFGLGSFFSLSGSHRLITNEPLSPFFRILCVARWWLKCIFISKQKSLMAFSSPVILASLSSLNESKIVLFINNHETGAGGREKLPMLKQTATNWRMLFRDSLNCHRWSFCQCLICNCFALYSESAANDTKTWRRKRIKTWESRLEVLCSLTC